MGVLSRLRKAFGRDKPPAEHKPAPWPRLCPECGFPFSRPTFQRSDGTRAEAGDPKGRWWLECKHCLVASPWPPRSREEKILWLAQGGLLE